MEKMKNLEKNSTLQEYFDLEEFSESRHQFHKGKIQEMESGTANHNRISGSLTALLMDCLEKEICEVFFIGLRVQAQNEFFTYPDIFVVCGEIKFYENRQDTISNPKVIFDVLSESTKDYDRGTKFMLYRSLESLTDYVLVSQSEVRIEHFHKDEKGVWSLKEIVSLEDFFSLNSPNCEVAVKKIYERVDFSLLEN
ncbi:MAG: Uma2 family endonuclease [Calditrichaeota bacterium]|nr:MAG: Uma2 family endonuclease [Calditrichota bacterium]